MSRSHGMAWLLLTLALAQSRAEASEIYGAIGGWAYDIRGSYTNTQRLDLEDDLALKPGSRLDFSLGFRPSRELAYVPAVELSYTRISARGQQRFQTLPITGLDPITGVLVPAETVVDNRTRVRDLEFNLRWPWQLGRFTLLGGFTVTRLEGSVQAADETSGEQMTQRVDEVFPLLSVGLAWQPLPSLRLSLSGDYIRYDGNRADELEALLVWKILGPVGLSAGYRQRRYEIDEPMNALDARVSGALVGVVMEVPI